MITKIMTIPTSKNYICCLENRKCGMLQLLMTISWSAQQRFRRQSHFCSVESWQMRCAIFNEEDLMVRAATVSTSSTSVPLLANRRFRRSPGFHEELEDHEWRSSCIGHLSPVQKEEGFDVQSICALEGALIDVNFYNSCWRLSR